jgi:hypothetical protein
MAKDLEENYNFSISKEHGIMMSEELWKASKAIKAGTYRYAVSDTSFVIVLDFQDERLGQYQCEIPVNYFRPRPTRRQD